MLLFILIITARLPSMNMNPLDLMKLGRKYMNLWPQQPELIEFFADYKIVQFSRIVCRFFPMIALLVFIVQLSLGSMQLLPQAIFYSLFILSMPLQALLILGIKADKFLPPFLATWYREGVARVIEQGGEIEFSMKKPRYYDLARLLNISFHSFKH